VSIKKLINYYQIAAGPNNVNGPVDQRKIACFASRRPWVQIPSGPLRFSL
jgi:hypothetical protein